MVALYKVATWVNNRVQVSRSIQYSWANNIPMSTFTATLYALVILHKPRSAVRGSETSVRHGVSSLSYCTDESFLNSSTAPDCGWSTMDLL